MNVSGPVPKENVTSDTVVASVTPGRSNVNARRKPALHGHNGSDYSVGEWKYTIDLPSEPTSTVCSWPSPVRTR